MIDREWERWAERELPRVRMAVAGFDPDCLGCRFQYKTQGHFVHRHTCAEAAGKMFRVTTEMQLEIERRKTNRRAAASRPKSNLGRSS